MTRRCAVLLSVVWCTLSSQARALQPPAPRAPAAADAAQKDTAQKEEGFPVASDIVRQACSPCHKPDDQGIMPRISERRTTPEGWQQTIKRMVALSDVDITPETARQVLKYLSTHHGLAPEEARPAAFEAERRLIDYTYADRDTEQTCTKCHSLGRVISQRRTREDWELLVAMHRGYYPLADFQAFRRMGPLQTEPGPEGRPPDNRHPMEKAIAHLSGAFPLRTPEWAAWSATMRPPRLQGRWALSGYQVGKGPVYGEVAITPRPGADDEFDTEARYVYARTGSAVARRGKALVYTGFQWRGRSFEGDADQDGFREVMLVERDWREIAGRWFTGAYDETGIDITLRRVGPEPMVLGLDVAALKRGAKTQTVRIYGVGFPSSLSPADVDFGNGVAATRVVGVTQDAATVELEVALDAAVGGRDLFVAGAARRGAVVVYDKVDAIKVVPQAGMARVGGIVFPKQYQQFEAVAYHDGPDGKPDTKDDLNLGRVDARWSLEEYTAVFGDDDRDFVGTVDDTGLFTPNVDGPNPKRAGNRNNVGDVWVVATWKSQDGKDERTVRARAHLLVTVPVYMKFDQPEVAR